MSPPGYINIVHESEKHQEYSSVSDALFLRLTCK